MLEHSKATSPPRSTQRNTAAPDALLARIVRGTISRLEPVLANTLDQLEKSLFTQADTGSCELQQAAFDAMRQVRRYRADLLPAFLSVLQARVEAATSAKAINAGTPTPVAAKAWSLLENSVVEEAALIDALAARVETRLHLPLYLLAHRVGVLLQRDAIETRLLPIGPHMLLRALFDASVCLDLATLARHALLRQFDRCLAPVLADLYASANACLADAGILPELHGYQSAPRNTVAGEVPARAAATAVRPQTPRPASDASTVPHRSAARGLAHDPATMEAGPRAISAAVDPAAMRWQQTSATDDELFGVMRELLGSRRALLGRFAAGSDATPSTPAHPVSPAQVSGALRDLQRAASAQAQSVPGSGVDPSRRCLKSLLLSHLQNAVPSERRAELPHAQGDVVDLLDMLFDHLLKDVPDRGVAAPLLARLQVPLLRVALDDSAFFTRNQHPARRMLDTLADAGLYWHDDADADEDFSASLRALVERVATEFDGDLTVFEVAREHLQQQLDMRMRKAAIAERRHVEAERGRERLERARIAAAEAIQAAIDDQSLPRFIHNLLTRAWTDVLALTMLRGRDGDGLFARQMEVTTWLVLHARSQHPVSGGQGEGAAAVSHLRQELSAGLCQIGYHLDDAESLARTAFDCSNARSDSQTETRGTREDLRPVEPRMQVPDAAASSPSARTEPAQPDDGTLAASATVERTLVAHPRLGVSGENGDASGIVGQSPIEVVPALETDAAHRQRLDQLRRLPFGTWFDLLSDGGRRQRCRMSWFSPITGRCLFVNHRGQRAGDHTLAWLAVEMEQGRARVVREAQASVVDSAWQAILGMLRSFAPKSVELAVA